MIEQQGLYGVGAGSRERGEKEEGEAEQGDGEGRKTLCTPHFYSHFLPTLDSSRAVISYWQKSVLLVLVNHLGGLSLPWGTV